MEYLIVNWINFNDVINIAIKYNIGVEVQDFCNPENIYNNQLIKQRKLMTIKETGGRVNFIQIMNSSDWQN